APRPAVAAGAGRRGQVTAGTDRRHQGGRITGGVVLMADAIPAADPALLAAQAKAGQAGVDAYKAAQNELTNQRQNALQQAMQEAALRGAPAGAMQSIGSTITAPYDQGISSMTQRSADYQAEMGRRDRTLADYNAAVQSARSLIP